MVIAYALLFDTARAQFVLVGGDPGGDGELVDGVIRIKILPMDSVEVGQIWTDKTDHTGTEVWRSDGVSPWQFLGGFALEFKSTAVPYDDWYDAQPVVRATRSWVQMCPSYWDDPPALDVGAGILQGTYPFAVYFSSVSKPGNTAPGTHWTLVGSLSRAEWDTGGGNTEWTDEWTFFSNYQAPNHTYERLYVVPTNVLPTAPNPLTIQGYAVDQWHDGDDAIVAPECVWPT